MLAELNKKTGKQMKSLLGTELYELILHYGDLKYVIGQRHYLKSITDDEKEKAKLKIRLEEDLQEKELVLDEINKLLKEI